MLLTCRQFGQVNIRRENREKKQNFEPGTFVFGAVYGVAPGVGEPEAGAAIRRSGPEGFLDPGMGARHAQALQFWGCHAIRLKGEDIFYERSAKNRLACRLYSTGEGLKGCPTVRMILQRLRALHALEATISKAGLA